METTEILQALPHLTVSDRLKIAEAALHLVQQDKQTLTKEQRKQHMAIVATTAIDDYSSDSELTAFTNLDGEDFYDEPTTSNDSVNSNA
jgi:predicted transposase YdaD